MCIYGLCEIIWEQGHQIKKDRFSPNNLEWRFWGFYGSISQIKVFEK